MFQMNMTESRIIESKRNNRNRKKAFLAAVQLAGILLVLTACGRREEPQPGINGYVWVSSQIGRTEEAQSLSEVPAII